MKSRTKILSISILLIGYCFSAHSQKVNLANFYLIQDNKKVLLYWTIDSGPTCTGITIMHSTDSVNFEEIGNIAGVCGSTSSSIPFNFKHESPVLNKTNYYKIRLGFSQFSEIQSLNLDYVEQNKIIVKPNPASENVTIGFNNDKNETYSITLLNSIGSAVFIKEGIKANNLTINTGVFENGNYFIILSDSDGRTIKGKLIITK